MTHPPSKKASAYLSHKHHELDSIFEKVKQLQQLDQKITTYIDPSLTPFWKVANLIGNKLIILAANGSIATQLRFQTTDLLRKFSQDPLLHHICQIECKVRPPNQPTSSTVLQRKKMQLLSEHTAELIQQMARTLDDDVLKEIMERIASRVD